jgi:osmotically-inducible protein OsmY
VGAIKFIIALPFRLVAAAIIIPIKLAMFTLKTSVKTTFVTTRAAMRSSVISFAAGVGLGWFLTSTPTGRQLVDQVRDLINGGASGPVDDDQLGAKVRTELASSTRTWHLPQPDVAVAAGVVTLTGEVPHETGKADLDDAARSVRGVISVNNLVTVSADDATGTSSNPSAEEVPA